MGSFNRRVAAAEMCLSTSLRSKERASAVSVRGRSSNTRKSQTGAKPRLRTSLGVVAKLGFKAHPHMFRHACGFQLANQGTDTRTLQAYLGHRNIQHTVRYTELSPTRFKNLWRD